MVTAKQKTTEPSTVPPATSFNSKITPVYVDLPATPDLTAKCFRQRTEHFEPVIARKRPSSFRPMSTYPRVYIRPLPEREL